jgi:MFS transporter, PAT family, solute carrier family 33 (acetyl-CoA transportor), member 1
MIAKIGFQANDAVTDLKLVEKGLSREDLALVVLIDFPFQIIGGYFAAKFSTGEYKLRPWLHGYSVRLLFAVFSMGLVHWFPTTRPVPFGYLAIVILVKVLTSFASYASFLSYTFRQWSRNSKRVSLGHSSS